MHSAHVIFLGFLELLKTISIVAASLVAIYGINSWRREAQWKKKYNLAEDVLALAYEVQHIISEVRSPASYSNEGKTRVRGKNELEVDSEILDRAFIVRERYESRKEPFIKLMTSRYRFMATYGRENEVLFRRFNQALNEIFMASYFLGTIYWKNQGRVSMTEGQLKQHLSHMEKHEKVFWITSDSDDEFGQKVNLIVEDFEKVCGPIIMDSQRKNYVLDLFS